MFFKGNLAAMNASEMPLAARLAENRRYEAPCISLAADAPL